MMCYYNDRHNHLRNIHHHSGLEKLIQIKPEKKCFFIDSTMSCFQPQNARELLKWHPEAADLVKIGLFIRPIKVDSAIGNLHKDATTLPFHSNGGKVERR